jgi:hypothetical protein
MIIVVVVDIAIANMGCKIYAMGDTVFNET